MFSENTAETLSKIAMNSTAYSENSECLFYS